MWRDIGFIGLGVVITAVVVVCIVVRYVFEWIQRK